MLKLARDDLLLAREIVKLKEGCGLGYRSIGKILGLHYKRVERLYKKYKHAFSHVTLPDVTLNPKTPVTSQDNLWSHETRRQPRELEDNTPILYRYTVQGVEKVRLGRTQKLILTIMLEDPDLFWTPSMIKRKLKLIGYMLTRRAIHSALRRLHVRGIVEYYGKVLLAEGEIIRGCYRVKTIPSGAKILVHNLRVDGVQIVSKEPMSVTAALFKSSIVYGKTFPVDQAEIHNDIPVDPEFIDKLRELGWRMTVIYPKGDKIRFEHRLWKPKGLTANLGSLKAWKERYKILTLTVYEIALHEMLRINGKMK